MILIGIIILMIFICLNQKKNASHAPAKISAELNYLPTGTFLRGVTLGYDEAVADFLWVRTIGYYGAHLKTDQNYTWLTHMLTITAELDPRYESPYEFAGVILPYDLNMVDEGMAFLEKGIKNIPTHNQRYWLQHFYLGFCYMMYKNEPILAAQQFEKAVAFNKNPPPYLPLLIGRLYASADNPDAGMEIVHNLLADPNSKIFRNKHMRNALIKRFKELIVSQDTNMLTNALSTYISIYDQRPSHLDQLVSGLILPFIPEEPFGGFYYLAPGTNQVLSSQAKGRLIVHKPKEMPKFNTSSP